MQLNLENVISWPKIKHVVSEYFVRQKSSSKGNLSQLKVIYTFTFVYPDSVHIYKVSRELNAYCTLVMLLNCFFVTQYTEVLKCEVTASRQSFLIIGYIYILWYEAWELKFGFCYWKWKTSKGECTCILSGKSVKTFFINGAFPMILLGACVL